MSAVPKEVIESSKYHVEDVGSEHKSMVMVRVLEALCYGILGVRFISIY